MASGLSDCAKSLVSMDKNVKLGTLLYNDQSEQPVSFSRERDVRLVKRVLVEDRRNYFLKQTRQELCDSSVKNSSVKNCYRRT